MTERKTTRNLFLAFVCMLLPLSRSAAQDVPRPFIPATPSAWAARGIGYGPFRDGQAPGKTQPSTEEIREDLHILAEHWQMLRVYGYDEFAQKVCEVIRDNQLPLKVMVGAWVATITDDEAAAANQKQVDGAIALANQFPDVVAAVCIGNESQVFWSFHKLKTEKLIEYIRQARKETKVPVTVADDFLFWTADESRVVADELDFLVTHVYAMWHAQQLDAAIAFTQEKLAAVQAKHPNKLVVLGEAGWATDKSASGDQAERLLGAAGEDEQAQFYADFCAWTAAEKIPYFYFSAFDENWKGGDDPHDAEKHWGLFRADRTAKKAIANIKSIPQP